MFGIELLEGDVVLVVVEYHHLAFGGPEVGLFPGGIELAFFERHVALREVGSSCFYAKAQLVLAVAVVVGAFGNGIPTESGLQRLGGLVACGGDQLLPFFLGGHVESVHAGGLRAFEIVEAAPVVALHAQGACRRGVVQVFCGPELVADADPLVGDTVSGVLVAAVSGGVAAFIENFPKFHLLVLLVQGLGGELPVLVVAEHRAFDVTVGVGDFRFQGAVFKVFLGKAFPPVFLVGCFPLQGAVFVEFPFQAFALVVYVGGFELHLAIGVLFHPHVFATRDQKGDRNREPCGKNFTRDFVHVLLLRKNFPNHQNVLLPATFTPHNSQH